jgi:hypothetical protein
VTPCAVQGSDAPGNCGSSGAVVHTTTPAIADARSAAVSSNDGDALADWTEPDTDHPWRRVRHPLSSSRGGGDVSMLLDAEFPFGKYRRDPPNC